MPAGRVDGTGLNDSIDGNYVDVDGESVSANADLIYALAGNDTVRGLAGNDTIYGGLHNDVLSGDEGDDHLLGEEGNDSLLGGAGNDLLEGGAGLDTLRGEDGNDTIHGGDGNDSLVGGHGNDILYGEDGNDIINTGFGTRQTDDPDDYDQAFGGAGNDSIYGESKNVYLDGGTGNDYIDSRYFRVEANGSNVGSANNATIIGGAGNDTIYAGYGRSTTRSDIRTGDGDDLIWLNTANDTVSVAAVEGSHTRIGQIQGVATSDRILFDPNAAGGVNIVLNASVATSPTSGTNESKILGPSTNNNLAGAFAFGGMNATGNFEGVNNLVGTNAADHVDGSAVVAGFGSVSFRMGAGNDTVIGTGWSDTIDGGTGNDLLSGGAGNDSLLGGDGDDTIWGDASTGETTVDGNDYIDGGAGDDLINGGAGNDTLLGGTGSDTIEGGSGHDLISGGDGSDTIVGGDGNDTIFTGNNNGIETAADGDDYVEAGRGNDNVTGGRGNDTIDGGAGQDSLIGGSGNDLLLGGDGHDTIWGDHATGETGADGNDYIDAGAGNDRVNAGGGNDTVSGGAGDDLISGGSGADLIDGGDGNDLIYGGGLGGGDDGAADTLTGGEGFDRFFVGSGDLITDFGNASGGNTSDGNSYNNDYVDLTAYYNESNLEIINAARVAQGLEEYTHALQWLKADQKDGVLDDISTQNGFSSNFTLRIENAGEAVSSNMMLEETTGVVCFGADVMILTNRGPVRAGDLDVGDLVETRDAGLQPIRWVGQRHLSASDLARAPKLKPIRIAKGALGKNTPTEDLVVSPQHRILVRSKIAQRMFSTHEVLASARQLLQLHGIDIAQDMTSVTYVHMLFDAHQIVFANGAEAESLYTGEEALRSLDTEAVEEIFTLFPELRDGVDPVPARQLLTGRKARQMLVRHIQNRRPLVM